MKRRSKFAIALAVAVITAAATTTAVWAVSRGGGDEAGVAIGGPAGAPAKASVNLDKCKSSKTDVITNDTSGLTTTSTTFVAIPGLSKTIKTPKGCLIATLSGDPFAAVGQKLEFARVVVDGAVGSPSSSQFTANDATFAQAHSAQFAFFLAAGTHTVTAQFASFIGDPVFLNFASLVITHG
jgi:hypothetical protein